jgi:hypothetical protein
MVVKKSQRLKYRGMKLSLSAFLRLDVPALTPTATPVPRLAPLPAAQIKRNFSADSISMAADYLRDNPTPIEAHARQAFKGLCLECQMIFATWKHPDGFGIPSHKRKKAHHSFKDLEHCWCPLCKMLLSDLLQYNEPALHHLRLPANYITKSDVEVFHHQRYVPCYYVELVFEFGNRRLKPYFMMFVAGGLNLSARLLCALFDNIQGEAVLLV